MEDQKLCDPGHKVCAYDNHHFGVWEQKKKGFPWDMFFVFAELYAIDPHTGKWLGTYYSRHNRIDGVCQWICEKIEWVKFKIGSLKRTGSQQS
jgi:hypothetical protein